MDLFVWNGSETNRSIHFCEQIMFQSYHKRSVHFCRAIPNKQVHTFLRANHVSIVSQEVCLF